MYYLYGEVCDAVEKVVPVSGVETESTVVTVQGDRLLVDVKNKYINDLIEDFNAEHLYVEDSDDGQTFVVAVKEQDGKVQSIKRRIQIDDVDTLREVLEEIGQGSASERERAMAAEQALDEKIDAETSRAESAEQTIHDDLQAEINRATLAEQSLSDDISAEAQARIEVQNNLDDEIQARISADNTLRSKIEKEVRDRIDAIEGIGDGIAEETSRAEQAEQALAEDISEENERALEAERNLASNITEERLRALEAEAGLLSKINKEISDRIADVDEEEARAVVAEQLIDEKLDQEIYDRKQALNNLDYTDTPDDTKFVSQIDEEDGVISVTRRSFNPVITEIDGDSSNAPKLNITIADNTSADAVLSKASTSIYGATKLTSTLNDSEETLATTPKYVDEKIKTLDVSDTADSTKYVSSVSETDGKISVSRELFNPFITIGAGTSSSTPTVNVTVAGNSGIAQAITTASTSVYGATRLTSVLNAAEEGLATTPKYVDNAIKELDVTDTVDNTKYVNGVSETDGKIVVSRNSFNPSITIGAGTASTSPTVNVIVAGNSGTAQAITTATTSVYGTTKLTSTPSASEEGLAATPKLVNDLVDSLDATVSQTAGADGLALSITETDGKVTALTGSIAPNTYDSYGDAATVKAELLGDAATSYNTLGKLEDYIIDINSKIPAQASSTNQLADKEYVTDSIITSAGFFRGSFATYAALMAVQWQTTDPNQPNYVSNNDYAYVEADETHNNEAWRYLYVNETGNTNNGWTAQFKINNAPFTSAQMAAINSGITSTSVAQIGTNQTNITNHVGDTNNPHSVTKAQVGLGNVDNTSDLNKPISTATQTALDAKANNTTTVTDVAYDSTNKKITKTINGTTSDVVTVATIKSDMDLSEFMVIGVNYVTAGKKINTPLGNYATAEGHQTTSSNDYTHAEGYNTIASNSSAHAEGNQTTASGTNSHAEGWSTTASGTASHAEGYGTTASNNYSHAEGYYTTAGGKSQHVFGEYNILDSSSTAARGTYVEIVGNGNSSSRSNARTLDWSGNQWNAGTIKIGGISYDDANAKEVATKEYVDNSMVILSYGNSTWQDFIDAYNKNSVIYCRASSNSNPATGSQTRLAFMAYVNNADTPTNVEFQYYRSMSAHTASQQGDQVFVYKLDKTAGWTVTAREASAKIVAGTGLSSTYSNDVLTLTREDELPSQSGQSGKFLTTDGTNVSWATVSAGTVNKYAETIAVTTAIKTFIINHGLGTNDVVVNIYDVATGKDVVADITRSESNGIYTLTIDFDATTPAGSYRVVVVG